MSEQIVECGFESATKLAPKPVGETLPEPVVELPAESVDEGISVSSAQIDTCGKGDRDRLHSYILQKIIQDNNCVSMKTLTNVYGQDGNDRRRRIYVKNIINEDFPN